LIRLLKVKHYYLIDMKNKSVDPEYRKFKDMALQLLGNKLFNDYITVRERFNVEPESFYEDWLRKSVIRPDAEIKLWTWRHFMSNLMEYRRIQKL